MSDFYVVCAKNGNGSTTYLELVQGKHKLADMVDEAESLGNIVQVYKTVAVDHEVYRETVGIEIYE